MAPTEFRPSSRESMIHMELSPSRITRTPGVVGAMLATIHAALLAPVVLYRKPSRVPR